MTVDLFPRPRPSLDEGDLADYGYTADEMREESLESVPQLEITKG
jgi:hypothetical protein